MFGLGIGEIFIIALIALVLFGDKDLPKNIKKFMTWFQEVKKVTQQAQQSLWEVKNDITRSVMESEHPPIAHDPDLPTEDQKELPQSTEEHIPLDKG